eukprot:3786-Heterococcus_DN1.PRE.2
MTGKPAAASASDTGATSLQRGTTTAMSPVVVTHRSAAVLALGSNGMVTGVCMTRPLHLIGGLSTYTVIEVSNAILQLAVSECFVHSSLYNMQARVHDERQFVIRTQAAQCAVTSVLQKPTTAERNVLSTRCAYATASASRTTTTKQYSNNTNCSAVQNSIMFEMYVSASDWRSAVQSRTCSFSVCTAIAGGCKLCAVDY